MTSNGSSNPPISTINVEINKNNKLVLSPKGLANTYKSKIVVDYNSNKKQIIRTSSIEDVKNQSDSKFNSGFKTKDKSYVTTVTASI